MHSVIEIKRTAVRDDRKSFNADHIFPQNSSPLFCGFFYRFFSIILYLFAKI